MGSRTAQEQTRPSKLENEKTRAQIIFKFLKLNPKMIILAEKLERKPSFLLTDECLKEMGEIGLPPTLGRT